MTINDLYKGPLAAHGFRSMTVNQVDGNTFAYSDGGYAYLKPVLYDVHLELDERGLGELRRMLDDLVGVPKSPDKIPETITRYRMKHK